MWFVFTEDSKGRYGVFGDPKGYYSRVQAEARAEDSLGITHIIEASNLAEAKQILRYEMMRRKGNEELYKNVRSKKV